MKVNRLNDDRILYGFLTIRIVLQDVDDLFLRSSIVFQHLQDFLRNILFDRRRIEQGAWTPFQMFSWGIIGFIAGILSSRFIRSKIILVIYGALAGVVYSLIMDIWTVLWMDGMFNPARFSAAVITALPVTLKYVISNMIFLIILAPLFGKKIERLKQKYGI